MNTTLCETFRSLSFRTFDQIGRARRVGHQPLEETFTDVNILELKDRHPSEILTHTFTKIQEGRNGADWEWWLTDSTMSKWLGLRVQAKVLHLKTNKFEHLHYKPGRSKKTYQLAIFKRECNEHGLIPLYCFYLHTQPTYIFNLKHCRTFLHINESYGCSLATLSHIESLQKNGERKELSAVLQKAYPWHCLVCCSGYGGATLPERAWAFLTSHMDLTIPRKKQEKADIGEQQVIGIRNSPPKYVSDILDGKSIDEIPSTAKGIIIIKETRRSEQS